MRVTPGRERGVACDEEAQGALSSRVMLAGRFRDRVRGLLATKAGDATLMLMPCNDVHTWGMSYSIDVAFLSKEGKVIAAYEDVGPGRRIRCASAVAVLERCSRCARAWFAVGDRVSVVRDGGEW